MNLHIHSHSPARVIQPHMQVASPPSPQGIAHTPSSLAKIPDIAPKTGKGMCCCLNPLIECIRSFISRLFSRKLEPASAGRQTAPTRTEAAPTAQAPSLREKTLATGNRFLNMQIGRETLNSFTRPHFRGGVLFFHNQRIVEMHMEEIDRNDLEAFRRGAAETWKRILEEQPDASFENGQEWKLQTVFVEHPQSHTRRAISLYDSWGEEKFHRQGNTAYGEASVKSTIVFLVRHFNQNQNDPMITRLLRFFFREALAPQARQ